jgi:hypothetical protein
LTTGDIPIPAPSLDLNFAANKSLVDDISGNNLITFSRASTGTFVGSNGLVQTAASGAPRFDHNPVTGESLGLLVEEARTNLVTSSTDLTTWSITNAAATREAMTGPEGFVANYTKLTLGVFTGSSGYVYKIPSPTSPSVFYTASIYAKAGTCRYIGISSQNYDSNSWGTYFDLETGTVTQNRGSTAYSIASVGSGWYKLSIGKDVGTGGSGPNFTIFPLTVAVPTNGPSNNIQPQYVGNGEYLHVWAPQFEAGAFPTSYIPTTGSTVTRAADVASVPTTGWIDPTGGTIIADYYKRNPGGDANGNTYVWSLGFGNPSLNYQQDKLYLTPVKERLKKKIANLKSNSFSSTHSYKNYILIIDIHQCG